MLTVMLYGVITEKMGVKGQHELEEIHMDELRHAIEDANNMGLSTINIHGTNKRHSYDMPFSAVHVIVPHAKEEDAIMSAKKAGARGVTIMKAHGMGLEMMDNFYNRLHNEQTDANLMFIVQTKKVDAIIKSIIKELDIVGEGKGIAYSYPITNLKGLTLTKDDL